MAGKAIGQRDHGVLYMRQLTFIACKLPLILRGFEPNDFQAAMRIVSKPQDGTNQGNLPEHLR